MLDRKSKNYSIAWFADQKRANRLNLEPPYQRKNSVWSKEYKTYFIDTIVKNYPCPAIFLYAETSVDGYTNYDVIDGKQRLTAIFEFISGDYPLTNDETNDYLKGLEFNDFPDDVKQDFWQYDIPVQQVSGASHTELTEAFKRLNRNVAKLNPQELRNAAFDGEFIRLMKSLTTDDLIWQDIGISTITTARRMLDIQFVSEIFLLTMHGILDGTGSKTLDFYYAEYDSAVPNRDEYLRRYRSCVRMLERFDVYRLRTTRFANKSDLYSLWAVLVAHVDQQNQIDYQETFDTLVKFENAYEAFRANDSNPNKELTDVITLEDLSDYDNNVRQGVNKTANRQKRASILAKLIRLQDDNSH